MRNPDERLITVIVTLRDAELCDEMKAACCLDSDSNLIRAALYNFAQSVMGPGYVDIGTFSLRVSGSEDRASAGSVVKRAQRQQAKAGAV